MNHYKVQVTNHYVNSAVVEVKASNEFSAKVIARGIFNYAGNDRHIKVSKV